MLILGTHGSGWMALQPLYEMIVNGQPELLD
jgi:hypothetical protein